MRLAEKRKRYAAHVRGQTLTGLVNHASNGSWGPPGSAGLTTESPLVKNAMYGTAGKKGLR